MDPDEETLRIYSRPAVEPIFQHFRIAAGRRAAIRDLTGNLAFMYPGTYMGSMLMGSIGVNCNHAPTMRSRLQGALCAVLAAALLVVMGVFWGSAEAHSGHKHAAPVVAISSAVTDLAGGDRVAADTGVASREVRTQSPASAFRIALATPSTETPGKQQGCPCGASCGCCTSASCGSAILGMTAPTDLIPRLASATYSRAPSQFDGGTVDPMPRPPNVFIAV